MQKTQFKGIVMLMLTAFIWGSSFVAQSLGMENVEAFTFNGIRTLMGAAVLLPVILIKDFLFIKKQGNEAKQALKSQSKGLIIGGGIMGVVLCIASNFQQFAFSYENHSAGKIAFITAFYMFFVPLFGLVLKKKVPLITWFCVILGTVGLYFLCVAGEGISAITMSDILTFICAIFFAVHILVIEKVSANSDPIKLSFIQFFVSGSISCIIMFFVESPSLETINQSILPMLYSGVMSCGLAYTFQVVGQKYTESTIASIILCLESVFGVLCGAIILKETLSVYEIIGCIIMFSAIIISQLGDKFSEKFNKKKV